MEDKQKNAIFASKYKWNMNDEKRYPEIDEEDGSCFTAAEPAYEAIDMPCVGPNILDEEVVYDVPPGTFGFYTDDPAEFLQHVKEMEAEINDSNTKWISSEDMWKGIKQEFPWLL